MATEIAIDKDIEEMLNGIAENAFPVKLILYNDDHHAMDEVLKQILKAHAVVGMACTVKQAHTIMLTAHKQGRAVCMVGAKSKMQKAKEVLDEICLKTEIE